jgi:hypothetical protein
MIFEMIHMLLGFYFESFFLFNQSRDSITNTSFSKSYKYNFQKDTIFKLWSLGSGEWL